MKRCGKCKKKKPLSQFTKDSRSPDKKNRLCKNCVSKKGKAYRQKYAKAIKQRNRNYRAANSEKVARYFRDKRLQRDYGIGLDDFNRLLEEQGGRCAICRRDAPTLDALGRGWHVDHDHVTGKIRGILCFFCNWGLGCMRDNPDFLRAAIDYLEKHSEPRQTAACGLPSEASPSEAVN